LGCVIAPLGLTGAINCILWLHTSNDEACATGCDGICAWPDASVPRWSPHPSLWCCSSPSSSTIR